MKLFESLKKTAALFLVVFSLLFVFVSPSYADSTPQIEFTADWQENLTGSLVRGGNFTVKYDSKRLPNIRDQKYGQPVWFIDAYAKFLEDNSQPKIQRLEPIGEDGILTTKIDIPNNGDKVILWFLNSGYYGRTEYDSDYGKNYNFPLSSQ